LTPALICLTFYASFYVSQVMHCPCSICLQFFGSLSDLPAKFTFRLSRPQSPLWMSTVPFVDVSNTLCGNLQHPLLTSSLPFVDVNNTLCGYHQPPLLTSTATFVVIYNTPCGCHQHPLWASTTPFAVTIKTDAIDHSRYPFRQKTINDEIPIVWRINVLTP